MIDCIAQNQKFNGGILMLERKPALVEQQDFTGYLAYAQEILIFYQAAERGK
jgi:hypothetical protein